MPKHSKAYSILLDESEQQLKKLRDRFKDASNLRNLIIHSDIIREKESTEAQVKLLGLKDYYGMRRSWGDFLKKCLAVILGFNIILVAFVGIGWLKFEDDWFLRIVLATNFADIIGLVYLVVKFLFSSQFEVKEGKKSEK